APVIEAFRSRVSDESPRRRGGRNDKLDELARLLPELGASRRSVRTDDAEGHAAGSQSQLFEVVLAVLDALSRAQPVVLVIEDIHWADRSTRELLSFLARNLRDERVL